MVGYMVAIFGFTEGCELGCITDGWVDGWLEDLIDDCEDGWVPGWNDAASIRLHRQLVVWLAVSIVESNDEYLVG